MLAAASRAGPDGALQASPRMKTGGKSDAVQVAVRVRPLSANETSQGSESCVGVVDASVLLAEKQFDFDAAFPATATQESVYTLVTPLIDQFFDGYNATVFAYGQTGSGKTYTMGNEFASSVTPTERGVIPRVIQNIFERVQHSTNPQQFVIKLSYLEILNEEIRDLLKSNTTTTSTGLSVRGDTDRGIVVSGLSEHVVNSMDQAGNFLRSGALARATASTNMNVQSSRSHAICTLVMEQHDVSAAEGGTETRVSKFHLVDLAGSERVRRTNSEGARLKEGININRGLLALGNVINALCERSRTNSLPSHVPYRDSKLTRLLQDSLGGNSKTLMIACISPADVNYEETSNTLRYASRTRKIENLAVINKKWSPENEVVYLRQQLEILQLQLLQHTQSTLGGSVRLSAKGVANLSGVNNGLEAENCKLREELVLANREMEKWKKISTDLTSKSKTEIQKQANVASKTSVGKMKFSPPAKNPAAVGGGQGSKSGHLSRLEHLRKFKNQRVYSQGGTSTKQNPKASTPVNKRRRTLMSPSTSTPEIGGGTILNVNAKRMSILSSSIKRSRVVDSDAQVTGSIMELLKQVLASQDVIHHAMTLDCRKALALEILRLEGSPSAEYKDKFVKLRDDLQNKFTNVRLLQQKLANVEKSVALPSELFPARLEVCHSLIQYLIEALMESKKECWVLSNCRSELAAANEQIQTQQELHNSRAQVLEAKLKKSMEEMQILREQATKKKISKRRKARESYETMETLFSSSGEEEDNSEADSDYVDEEDRRKGGNKRKRRIDTPPSNDVDIMDEIDELLETSVATCCSCHGKCATKACACKSQSRVCSNECSCNSSKCRNRGGGDNPQTTCSDDTPGGYCSFDFQNQVTTCEISVSTDLMSP